ncbi:uncharacterized protein L969DRAFT_88670 [Mixia osmundae IAM 14324]|uniref:HCP-like protein n=1 Tax=Mixia osmundae (strain CBS 9802 / IAM 14324 / JCM 22182 / KY 12970) TaxID=764103 RepID=G7DZ20_MIXOS|nr:uncharacterized protein L969DRAFT_88670 [Mixia osmundae IAM 14324]KEI38232.1 hypothetical protein L969DRAFT_88670 [Mixia osmundae IAM 14324]GAA95830.1 hypothetical protein E5Q_02487 [Mixia osmundae IAM 14324]
MPSIDYVPQIDPRASFSLAQAPGSQRRLADSHTSSFTRATPSPHPAHPPETNKGFYRERGYKNDPPASDARPISAGSQRRKLTKRRQNAPQHVNATVEANSPLLQTNEVREGHSRSVGLSYYFTEPPSVDDYIARDPEQPREQDERQQQEQYYLPQIQPCIPTGSPAQAHPESQQRDNNQSRQSSRTVGGQSNAHGRPIVPPRQAPAVPYAPRDPEAVQARSPLAQLAHSSQRTAASTRETIRKRQQDEQMTHATPADQQQDGLSYLSGHVQGSTSYRSDEAELHNGRYPHDEQHHYDSGPQDSYSTRPVPPTRAQHRHTSSHGSSVYSVSSLKASASANDIARSLRSDEPGLPPARLPYAGSANAHKRGPSESSNHMLSANGTRLTDAFRLSYATNQTESESLVDHVSSTLSPVDSLQHDATLVRPLHGHPGLALSSLARDASQRTHATKYSSSGTAVLDQNPFKYQGLAEDGRTSGEMAPCSPDSDYRSTASDALARSSEEQNSRPVHTAGYLGLSIQQERPTSAISTIGDLVWQPSDARPTSIATRHRSHTLSSLGGRNFSRPMRNITAAANNLHLDDPAPISPPGPAKLQRRQSNRSARSSGSTSPKESLKSRLSMRSMKLRLETRYTRGAASPSDSSPLQVPRTPIDPPRITLSHIPDPQLGSPDDYYQQALSATEARETKPKHWPNQPAMPDSLGEVRPLRTEESRQRAAHSQTPPRSSSRQNLSRSQSPSTVGESPQINTSPFLNAQTPPLPSGPFTDHDASHLSSARPSQSRLASNQMSPPSPVHSACSTDSFHPVPVQSSTFAKTKATLISSVPQTQRGKADPPQLNTQDPIHCLQLGIDFHERGDLPRSALYFERSASLQGGCGTGMLMWGLALRHGWGVQQNQSTGFAFIKRAAESVVDNLEYAVQHPDDIAHGKTPPQINKAELVLAVYELAQCMLRGWGTKKDKKRALKYFELAAKLGDADAQQELGYCYQFGKGCPKDLKKAAHYYRLAEQQGFQTFGLQWIHKPKWQD